jgi:hypothetical protein
MVEVKMGDPDRIEVWPFEPFLCHSENNGRAKIEQNVSRTGFEPETRAASFWVWDRRAGAEDCKFHALIKPHKLTGIKGLKGYKKNFIMPASPLSLLILSLYLLC